LKDCSLEELDRKLPASNLLEEDKKRKPTVDNEEECPKKPDMGGMLPIMT
jgi:hypothetical protein